MKKKSLLIAVALLCMCFCLCACAMPNIPFLNKQQPTESQESDQESFVDLSDEEFSFEDLNPDEFDEVEETPPSPTPTPFIPSETSASLKLYSFALANGHKYVVDEYGQYVGDYSFDDEGNMVDTDGVPVIMAANLTTYKPIRTMYFSQDAYELQSEQNQRYSNCVIDLFCAPANATNTIICLSSDNTSVIEIRPNGNAKFATIPEGILRDNEIAIRVEDVSQPVQVFIRVTNGLKNANIHARTIDNSAETECVVSVEVNESLLSQAASTTNTTEGANRPGATATAATPAPSPSPAMQPIMGATEFVNASGNPTNHIHTYRTYVTEPTQSEMGYTTYVCAICGYSYVDDYTSKLAPSTYQQQDPTPQHIHSYSIFEVVPATPDSRGYTVYKCSGCGESYKANYTDYNP